MKKTQSIQNQLDLLPSRVGVYKFYDLNAEILYVGKAVNLRARVSSYFREDHYDRPHIIPMISKIVQIEFIETENEIEALVLETALIKKLLPKFNIDQKDDKSYAWIYISMMDELPQVNIIRSINRKRFKNGRVFGPYPSGRAIRQLYKYIRQLHPFCTCTNPTRPCLYYHMGLCINPKFGEYTHEQYMESINGIIKFLEGNKKRHIFEMEKKMKNYAADQKYESAAELRDKIVDLKHLGNRIRGRKKVDDIEYIENRNKMLSAEVKHIAKELGVESLDRIECYDISNIQGEHSYGSMVVSLDGQRETSQYRAFKIKTVIGPDDYASLHEVLQRRVRHIKNNPNDTSLNSRPNMVLIDGGKGQLRSVADVIPEGVFLLGISKGRKYKKQGGRKVDEFWVNRNGVILQIKIKNPRVLINLRDEAHRFALKHHRKARQFTKKKSILDTVKGLGPKGKKKLLIKFGSVESMKKVSVLELNNVINNKGVSDRLYSELHSIDDSQNSKSS